MFPRIFGDDSWSWLAAPPSERAAFDRVMAMGVWGVGDVDHIRFITPDLALTGVNQEYTPM